MKLTLSLKLNISKEIKPLVVASMTAFCDACNYINKNTPDSLISATKIQKFTYKEVREKYSIPANYACQAARLIAANRKTAKTLHNNAVKKYKPSIIKLDARLMSVNPDKQLASVTLLGGRKKFSLNLSNYHREKLKYSTLTSGQLVKSRNGKFYLQLHYDIKEENTNEVDKFLGVDLGKTSLVRTSQGVEWDGKEVCRVRGKYRKQRAHLQKKASKALKRQSRKNIRRVSKRLSGIRI